MKEEVDVIPKMIMMDSLLNEMTEKQRRQAQECLQENEAIFSKGEYDIG